MMTTEQLTDHMGKNSVAAVEAISQHDLAKEALERADSKALFELYERACKQRTEMLGVIITLAEEGFGSGVRDRLKPPAPQQDSDIAAVKEIAMASINLANAVLSSRAPPQ